LFAHPLHSLVIIATFREELAAVALTCKLMRKALGLRNGIGYGQQSAPPHPHFMRSQEREKIFQYINGRGS